MINSVRGKHSSPGIYYKETELVYSAKSLGITTLGLAGETLKGPAFEPITISDWSEFQYYFGGTSTKKFKDSQYPKYELPFIAKAYLSESKQLEVVRVLGLSGYNAGPAWVITGEGEDPDKKYVVAVLRSKGHYEKYFTGYMFNSCTGSPQYDYLLYDAKCVEIECYKDLTWELDCNAGNTSGECREDSWNVTPNNLGRFVLKVTKQDDSVVRYAVSLNYGSKDYIYDVLGKDNESGSSPLFVEEVYDVALSQYIAEGKITKISDELTLVDQVMNQPICDPVLDFLTIPNEDLKRSNLEQTFIFDERFLDPTGATAYVFSGTEVSEAEIVNGGVYQVRYTKAQNADGAVIGYYYAPYMVETTDESGETKEEQAILTPNTEPVSDPSGCTQEGLKRKAIYINAYGRYFEMNDDNEVVPVQLDMNNYKERFRPAVTPWLVSQVLGNGDTFNVKRMFRFITISDGNTANKQVKISIEKIRPDDGTFTVVIRDYNDSDLQQNVLERYNNCSMDPAASNYIGKKIGTANGEYIIKSKYVSLEINPDDTIKNLVPCGFLGYPVRNWGDGLEMMAYKYNTQYYDDIRVRKQYFGMSDILGVDIDMLSYKGVAAYKDKEYSLNGYTNGFHLDTRANLDESGLSGVTVTVDQEDGYVFDTVSPNASVGVPVIDTDELMYGTVFEDVNARKFTVYPFGGYDGWDIYRGARTTGDEFKSNKYKGAWEYGESRNFTKVFDTTGLALDGINAISSDYYAFLAGYRQFANPEAVDINLFATPGIDLFNNILLTEDAMNVIEDDEDGRKGDALYIVTTPDKPFGASDAEDEMYTADDIVDLLEDTNVDTSYAATYFPWVKYFDSDSGTYINLPPTKDVMRNFAFTDNTAAPWFASAGINRGPVNCVKAHKFTKQSEEDTLYDGRVNVIKTFASDGVKVWGNKTLSTTEGPLNRINVRRLMIRVKKLITQAARQLIFEQNDATLRKQFQSLVEPILANVRANRGITDYRLDIQQSVECEDEHELSATIWIKPTPTLEYISINFNITAQCVTFDE